MEKLYLDTEFSSMYSYEEKKSGEILQLSAIAVKDGIEVGRFNEKLKPLTSVWSSEAEKVHMISRKVALGQRDPELVANDFISWLRSLGDEFWTVCGFNCGGDKHHLISLFLKYGVLTDFFNITKPVWFDVLHSVNKKSDYITTKKRKLSDLCDHYGVNINAHDAIEDCIGAWRLDEIVSQIRLPNKNYMSVDLNHMTKREKINKYISMKYLQAGSDGSMYLSKHATADPEAMKVIVEHFWDLYC